MTKKKRRLEYTITLPDHTQRVFSTKYEMRESLGISQYKIDKSLMNDNWVYEHNLKGWIKVTVKEKKNEV